MALLNALRAQARRKVACIAALLLLASGAGCARKSSNAPLFEAHPRAVLADLGIPASRDPQLAVSSSGMLSMLAVYQANGKNHLGFTMSHDGGDHFTPIIPVSQPESQVSSHGENSPILATSPTAIYALWEQPRTDGGNDLMVARSLNFGNSFDKPVLVIDDAKPAFHGFASLAIAPNGDVYVVWLDGRETRENPETFDLYVARSQDHGGSFGPNTRVARFACPCCRPGLAFGSRGEVYVAWRKDFPGDIRDIVLSVSRDAGKSFAPEVRVAEDNWRLRGCPHSGPSIVENAGRLYLAWLTEGQDERARVQVSWSDDSGAHFHGPLDASPQVIDANHPFLVRSENGRVFLAYQGRALADKSAQWTPSAAFVSQVDERISAPQLLPNGNSTVSYPALAAGTAGRLFVAWTNVSDKTTAIQLLRGRRTQLESPVPALPN